jgi:hypothetical protein
MIIGVPSSRRDLVSNDSPFAFSMVTEGTCAAAMAEIKSAMLKRNVLILFLVFSQISHPSQMLERQK